MGFNASGAEAPLPDSGEIEGYRVRETLYESSMTIFMRVEDASGQSFILKIPTRQSARDRTLRGRFEREVEILNKLGSAEYPSLKASGFYATRDIQSIPYIVTDMPRGETLDIMVERHKATGRGPDLEGGIQLLRRLAVALAKAHAKGIVHRNLKPQKIAVSPQGEVQILDFVLGLGSNAARNLTSAGVLLGTPTYMAPEQARDPHNVDGRADLYSLGLIIYEYVTHAHPFGAPPETGMAEIVRHMTQEPKPASRMNPKVPPDLDGILGRLLKRKPEDRYQNASELLSDLDRTFPVPRPS